MVSRMMVDGHNQPESYSST